jgi:galactose mutarotase-like enzyme
VLPIETVHLRRGGAEAWLAPTRGGLVTRFAVDGDDVLYLDEATLADATQNVRGGIPILFPIAGKLRPDTLPGATAPLRQHGFARNRAWQTIAVGPSEATLGLDADDGTRTAYPPEFALRCTVTLGERSLEFATRIENRGATSLRAQPGLHPYFRVPDKAGARVASRATQAWDNVAGARVPFDAAALRFDRGEVDLHLLDHAEPRTQLTRPGARDVLLEWSADQRVLVLWTLPGRPFVCVEPWSAPANALHTGGALEVAPGGSHESRLTIALAP